MLAVCSIIAFSSVVGCGSSEPLDEVGKAKKIAQLRKQAEEQLAVFIQSSEDPDGVDFEALEKYVELHAETTRIAPATCPLCFAYYAEALSRLGLYYRTLVVAQEREIQSARGDEKARLEDRRARSRQQMLEAFRNSNRQFENYIQSCRATGQGVDPERYWWIVSNSEFLEDYTRALYYLDLYAANVSLSEPDKRNVEGLRASYLREKERLEEERMRLDLER